jgi:hypothetical protein
MTQKLKLYTRRMIRAYRAEKVGEGVSPNRKKKRRRNRKAVVG